jgi:hypothetical protein
MNARFAQSRTAAGSRTGRPMPVQRCGSVPCPTGHCKRPDDDRAMQRSTMSAEQQPGASFIDHGLLTSRGQPLDPMTRVFMEQQFGHNFRRVQVHADAGAAEAARAIHASAFTIGHDLFFDAGLYAPATARGRRLLAHELTHVRQQANGMVPPGIDPGPNDPREREAERQSYRIARNGTGAIAGDPPNSADAQAATDSHRGPSSALQRQSRGVVSIAGLHHPLLRWSAELEAANTNQFASIGKGAAGDFVRRLQWALIALGYQLPTFGADGNFGPETAAAVISFQTAAGLKADGVVGPGTLGRLDALLIAMSVGPTGAVGSVPLPSVEFPVSANGPMIGMVGAAGSQPPAYWQQQYVNFHKEFIDLPFVVSGGFETGFDFKDPKSWDTFKLAEEAGTGKRGAPWSLETNDFTRFYVNAGITPKNFVNLMLGRFITGIGPENFVFAKNGAVSNAMKDSEIAKNAIRYWHTVNEEAIFSGGQLTETKGESHFGAQEQAATLLKHGNIVNVPQFTGSATITVTPQLKGAVDLSGTDTDELLVTIDNVTSATSGDLWKHAKIYGKAPSFPKDYSLPKLQQYTNIRQVFQFTIPVASGMPSVRSDSGRTICVPPLGISNTDCGAYARNAWWLPLAYVNNATCACQQTPNTRTARCVRKRLQDMVAATPASTKKIAAKYKTLDEFGSPTYPFYIWYVLDSLMPRIYSDHVRAYRECCCPSGPADPAAWVGVTTMPLPCDLIGLAIKYFGSCHGTPGRW